MSRRSRSHRRYYRKYGYSWKRERDRFIKAHPFCEICSWNGIVTEAVTVHHVKPLSEGGKNDPDNLMALCDACHKWVHSMRGKGE